MNNKKNPLVGSGQGTSTLSLAASGALKKQVPATNTSFSPMMPHSDRAMTTQTNWPTEGWELTTPEAQGLHSSALAKMLKIFRHQAVHSVAVIRNGHLVAEAYNEGTGTDILQDMKSVTKSITSALVGIALSEFKLSSIDQKAADFFPELATDPVKSKIMLKHLLSMTSGTSWDNANERSSAEMMYAEDWVQYILERPAQAEPGASFNYSNGDAHLLSAIMTKATGESMFDYAVSRLFGPLGIKEMNWNQDPQEHTIGAWAMALTLRDMAKLGYLYLNEGQWEDKTLIPQPWIRESLTRKITLNYSNGTQGGYGFYWWSKTLPPGLIKGDKKAYDMYYASGSGGRRIFVVPDLQLVVAMTAESADVDMPENLLHHVVQAVRSANPLPENSVAQDELERAIRLFKMSVES
ncbi:beta-lactamase family protein [Paenibacillus sp. HWE-109]|uniref:serine hydrolase domain-containing protein n=1 Tax=Paenibacillus sp. HWE-109 TaxID=1306526 RepID=UPI001EDD7EA4|nr:serine hydrolase [Paenibacillus sp. HWE-109]UKS25383.1 beta-lactamase family protein [Paenibacillus sp. HWE-109]